MVRFRSTTGRAARTVLAMLLLLGFLASSFETVAGLVRDGSVHHETVAAAFTHSSEGAGEHGHETDAEGPDQDHGPDHQHGTGADHCTHAHGASLLSPAAVALNDDEVWMPPVASQTTPSDHRVPPPFHPPRV